jgi:hypothetical protein
MSQPKPRGVHAEGPTADGQHYVKAYIGAGGPGCNFDWVTSGPGQQAKLGNLATPTAV